MSNTFNDMSDLLDSVYNEIEKSVKLNIEEKYKITNAGAKVLKKEIEQSIIANKHVRIGKSSGEYTHLKDSVETSKKDEMGMKVGSTRVGFDAQHAHIARFINDGTKHIQGDHFLDNARLDAKSSVADAMKKAYKGLNNGN